MIFEDRDQLNDFLISDTEISTSSLNSAWKILDHLNFYFRYPNSLEYKANTIHMFYYWADRYIDIYCFANGDTQVILENGHEPIHFADKYNYKEIGPGTLIEIRTTLNCFLGG